MDLYVRGGKTFSSAADANYLGGSMKPVPTVIAVVSLGLLAALLTQIPSHFKAKGHPNYGSGSLMTRLGLEVALTLAQTNGGRAPARDEFLPLYLENGGRASDWNHFAWDKRLSFSNIVDGKRIVVICTNLPATSGYCYVGLANGEVHQLYLKDAITGTTCLHSIAKVATVVISH